MNCVFINHDSGKLIVHETSNNTGNKIQNSIITGFSSLETYSGSGSGVVDKSYSNFWNNSFAAPSGTGILSGNPLFVDTLNSNYRLQTGSPDIDSGTSSGASSIDYDGNARPQGSNFDIGAFER
jgi:hypothetical protein